MKCPNCGKSWGTTIGKFYHCYECGEVVTLPMTNEEWFCSLSTEEKAKWLSRNSKFMYGCGRMETTPKIMYEEDWECWLKEIHNDRVVNHVVHS